MSSRITPPARVTAGNRPVRKFEFLPAERKKCSVLIVEPDEDLRALLRSSMRNLGFGDVVSVFDHYAGIKKFSDRRFSHVLFEARDTDMPAAEFLTKVNDISTRIVTIPTSFDPTVDDVFELLKAGSRGYIVKPFTEDSVEEAVILATKGDPIAEEILNAQNRNQALAALVFTALDSYAKILRQARVFETAKIEVTRTKQQFERAVQMGKLFAQDGDAGLLITYIELALQISETSASRLGRTRRRRQREKEELSFGDL